MNKRVRSKQRVFSKRKKGGVTEVLKKGDYDFAREECVKERDVLT